MQICVSGREMALELEELRQKVKMMESGEYEFSAQKDSSTIHGRLTNGDDEDERNDAAAKQKQAWATRRDPMSSISIRNATQDNVYGSPNSVSIAANTSGAGVGEATAKHRLLQTLYETNKSTPLPTAASTNSYLQAQAQAQAHTHAPHVASFTPSPHIDATTAIAQSFPGSIHPSYYSQHVAGSHPAYGAYTNNQMTAGSSSPSRPTSLTQMAANKRSKKDKSKVRSRTAKGSRTRRKKKKVAWDDDTTLPGYTAGGKNGRKGKKKASSAKGAGKKGKKNGKFQVEYDCPMPFTIGTSTNRSFSIPVNIQELLAKCPVAPVEEKYDEVNTTITSTTCTSRVLGDADDGDADEYVEMVHHDNIHGDGSVDDDDMILEDDEEDGADDSDGDIHTLTRIRESDMLTYADVNGEANAFPQHAYTYSRGGVSVVTHGRQAYIPPPPPPPPPPSAPASTPSPSSLAVIVQANTAHNTAQSVGRARLPPQPSTANTYASTPAATPGFTDEDAATVALQIADLATHKDVLDQTLEKLARELESLNQQV